MTPLKARSPQGLGGRAGAELPDRAAGTYIPRGATGEVTRITRDTVLSLQV